MKDSKCEEYGRPILRLGLGVLFLFAGIMKLSNPAMIIGILGTIGFPFPAFFGWVLLLVEMLGGLALLAGKWTKQITIVLSLVMLVAIITVSRKDPMQALKDFNILAGLIALHYLGPGKWTMGGK